MSDDRSYWYLILMLAVGLGSFFVTLHLLGAL